MRGTCDIEHTDTGPAPVYVDVHADGLAPLDLAPVPG